MVNVFFVLFCFFSFPSFYLLECSDYNLHSYSHNVSALTSSTFSNSSLFLLFFSFFFSFILSNTFYLLFFLFSFFLFVLLLLHFVQYILLPFLSPLFFCSSFLSIYPVHLTSFSFSSSFFFFRSSSLSFYPRLLTFFSYCFSFFFFFRSSFIGLYTPVNYFGQYATCSHKDGGRSHIQSRETIGQKDHVTCLKLGPRVNSSPVFFSHLQDAYFL